MLKGYRGFAAGVGGLHAGSACGRNTCRGCRESDKHAFENKVSLNGLTVALFRVGAGCLVLLAGLLLALDDQTGPVDKDWPKVAAQLQVAIEKDCTSVCVL